jgi:hypothetical protein
MRRFNKPVIQLILTPLQGVDLFKMYFSAFVDNLYGLAVAHHIGRAERRMTIDKSLKGPAEGRNVQVRQHAHGEKDVVGRTIRSQLVEKPKRALTVGKRLLGK